MLDLATDAAETVAKELSDGGATAAAYTVDVSDPGSVEAAVDAVAVGPRAARSCW